MSLSLRRLTRCATGLFVPACLAVAGCDSAPPAASADASAKPASGALTSAPAATTSTVGDRYPAPTPMSLPATTPANMPKYDPAVQQAAYQPTSTGATVVAPQSLAAASVAGGIPSTEPEFVPGVEDLQLYEQPDFSKVPPGSIPTGWSGSHVYLNHSAGSIRPNPLPHSP